MVDKDETIHQQIFAACGRSISVVERGGKQIGTLSLVHSAHITALLYHEETSVLISGSMDGVIKLWDSLLQLKV